jgi:hypothetical protein
MKELDLLVENYFTPALDATDILRLVEQLMNEGQSGTAFEDVIVDVARRGFKKEVRDAEGEITQYATGGKNGSKEYNPKPKDAPFKGQTFPQLAITCLKLMGYTEEQIKNGVDPEARKASGAGVSGDPKTDIIIGGKRISLKLPGDVQLSSGAAASTNATIRAAFEKWKEIPQAQRYTEEITEEELKKALNDVMNAMAATTGKIYYPHETATRDGAWADKVPISKNNVKSHEAILSGRTQDDWEKNKYPSGGIPDDWKWKYKRDENGDVKTLEVARKNRTILKPVRVKAGPQDSEILDADGKPQKRFPKMKDFIDTYIAHVKEKRRDKPSTQQSVPASGSVPYEIYEEFRDVALVEIKEKLANLAEHSDTFYYILVDEWLTGRMAFADSAEEHVAQWLLSPWSFDDMTNREDTQKLAKGWKGEDTKYIGVDMRAKARSYLGKEMAMRIDFKADKYYKKKFADFYKKLKFVRWARQAPYLNEEDGEEANSEKEFIQNLAKGMAKSLVIEI